MRLFSDEWRMPIALATGVALLIGYSLQVLVDQSMGRWTTGFHTAGHALVWVSLALGAIHGVKAAVESLRNFEPNIDVLMVVGAGLAAAIGHPGEGALLLFMFTLAGALEHRALARAKDAVARLSKLMPDEALRREGDRWVPAKPDDLAPADLVLVRPGETIPADGEITTGHSTIDQSTLTGESLPRTVDPGDQVFAGTMNQNGALEIRITRPIAQSSLKRIMDLVIEAQAQRQPMQRLIDRFSTPYTLMVFAFAAGALIFFMTFYRGEGGSALSFADAAYRAITLLIVASPCALVIATPTATLCGLNRAARAGLLVKGGDALERLANVRTVVLDKTGTLTTGQIEVRAMRTLPEDLDPARLEQLLNVVLAIEERSTHPIAGAIVRFARQQGRTPAPIENVQMVAGKGITAQVDGRPAFIGNAEYVREHIDPAWLSSVDAFIADVQQQGEILALFVHNGSVLAFRLADTPRPGADQLVRQLHQVGVRTVAMLTGDHQVIAQNMARDLEIDIVHADLLPEEKVEKLHELKSANHNGGRLAVVGDGVNDAPALAMADIGLAMGGIGTDVALETADVVILHDDLIVVPWAFQLARRVRGVMLANLLFAFGVILILAVFALVGWIPMGVGVIGHEGSTLIVVANSLQLLAVKDAESTFGR